ncbi:uncharacterized protein LOC115602391 isoform X3 [Strigops habroptila]|uniref:uncharacterized protein LOC115602391 isoform X3 n=1 Tax=Strigops habroptila TaxID=2489341 RepID=UPI0011CF7C38|nr:uncharacterized protein LOC115602391 isoform X3 [Strigops habroptila]
MGVLSCVKYLMFIFNVLVFVSPAAVLREGTPVEAGGTCLVAVGLWVAVDPSGFQHIVAANGVLSAGAFLLLAVGMALALLGFLGCCGALRRSRALLLGFFILVSLVFITQLVGAVLFLVHWKQDPKTLGTVPASRSCTRGHRGHACAAPAPGSCRRGSCWAGSSVGTGAPATSMSRAASPPSAGPCRSTFLSRGSAAWSCWASRSLPCSLPSAFITTSTEQDKAQQSQALGLEPAVGRMLQFLVCQSTALSFPAPVPSPGGQEPSRVLSLLLWPQKAGPGPFLGAGTGHGLKSLQATAWSRRLW